MRHSARPDAAVLAYPVVSAHNDTVGTNGVAPFSMGCARFGNVGPATARGDSRPIRHHGSIEVLLGHPSDGRPRTREAESEISLEDLAASAPPATELPPFFLWHTAQDGVVPVHNTYRLNRTLTARGGRVEVHIYTDGGRAGLHGLELAQDPKLKKKGVSRWTAQCAEWLRRTLQPPR